MDVKTTEQIQEWDNGTRVVIFDPKGACTISLWIDKSEPRAGIISDLYVHKFFRGKGLGQMLLDKACKYAKDSGCEFIELRSDAPGWTRDWYKRQGFNKQDEPVWLRKEL